MAEPKDEVREEARRLLSIYCVMHTDRQEALGKLESALRRAKAQGEREGRREALLEVADIACSWYNDTETKVTLASKLRKMAEEVENG